MFDTWLPPPRREAAPALPVQRPHGHASHARAQGPGLVPPEKTPASTLLLERAAWSVRSRGGNPRGGESEEAGGPPTGKGGQVGVPVAVSWTPRAAGFTAASLVPVPLAHAGRVRWIGGITSKV